VQQPRHIGGAPPPGGGVHNFYVMVTALNVASTGLKSKASAALLGFTITDATTPRRNRPADQAQLTGSRPSCRSASDFCWARRRGEVMLGRFVPVDHAPVHDGVQGAVELAIAEAVEAAPGDAPEDACSGLTPARAAKAASERHRPGWDQATSRCAAQTGPTPGSASSAEITAATRSCSCRSLARISWSSRRIRWARLRSRLDAPASGAASYFNLKKVRSTSHD
jgi:hypothetical protein